MGTFNGIQSQLQPTDEEFSRSAALLRSGEPECGVIFNIEKLKVSCLTEASSDLWSV